MSEIYTDPPQSRNEAIIKATIDGTEYTAPPQSRMEDLLLELKEVIEHGGGGGTSDYPDLTHKPQVNGVELVGDKSSADLGLMPAYEVDTTPTESSENLITSGGVWNADKNINNKLQGSKSVSSTSGTIEIPDYGMTESIQMYFKPTQDLHGYDKPWAGGAGKNKLPLVLSDIKSANTSGTWSGNVYTLNGVTFEVLTDSADNVLGIKVNGTASANILYFTIATNISVTEASIYSWGSTYNWNNQGVVCEAYDGTNSYAPTEINGISIPTGTYTVRFAMSASKTLDNYPIYPMIRLSTETDADFEPYSNICPISGQDNATFEWTDDQEIETEVSMNFGKTCYGGFCQFNGQVYSQWSYIASYNGETLSGEWVSDRDEYVAGTTPTIGAEVAYYDSQSTDYFRVTPPVNLNLTDDYTIEYNGYMANISYQPKNTVLLQAKEYTNQKISALGFPTPPTTDGTYHLECSVSGGIPTIRWVLNS